MQYWSRACILAGFVLGGPVLAAGTPESSARGPGRQEKAKASLEQLERIVDEQRGRIEDLRRQIELADTARPDTARIEEVERVVREVIDDAGFREGLYPDVAQVGYDQGFYIKSSDEAFLLNITGMMQVRWTGLNRQTDNPRLQGRNKQDDINGFEVQYLLLSFDGYIHDPKLTYLFNIVGDTDQAHQWETEYAFITYEFSELLAISAGLIDFPQGFSNLAAHFKQQFVERPLAEKVFAPSTSVGLAVGGLLFGKLDYAAGVYNGMTNPYDSPSRGELDTNFAYAASLIYHILGDGVGDEETDLPFSKDPLWDVGMSFAHNDDNGDDDPTFFYVIPDRVRRGRGIGGYGEADLTGTEMYQFGGHTAFRYRGFSLTAEWYLRTIDGEDERSEWERLTGRSDSAHFQGGYIEAGYFIIPKKVEVAARLGGIWDAASDNTWEYTFGVNYYPYESHNFKIQADFTRIEEAAIGSEFGNWSQNDEVNMVRVSLQAAF